MTSATLPRLVVTGSSGFLGQRVLDALKSRYQIFGIARRSQARCGAPVHPNIHWHQADIAVRELVDEAFEIIRRGGGADLVLHLAAHYDFTGESHPEYWRTNVVGLKNVLDACRELAPRRFIFASSIAACDFPPPGEALDETGPADGEPIYSRTKRLGEEMLAGYADAFPSTVIRFAALFSDWCEYPPLYIFLHTWLSPVWNQRILGGDGRFAIPYLHVRDGVTFVERVLERSPDLAPGEVVLASPDGAVSTRALFEAATRYYYGQPLEPIPMPKALVLPGMILRDWLGRLLGKRPFERPWMARYLDRQLTVDAHRTRELLGWAPRERLLILRRLPFLLENLKTDPVEWHRRNEAAMKTVRVATHLRIYRLLEKNESRISEAHSAQLASEEGRRELPTYQKLRPEDLKWSHKVALRHLMNAVRTNDKAVFMDYCRDLAQHRFEQGFHPAEICAALRSLRDASLRILREDPEVLDIEPELEDHISKTLLFGCDQVEETFDHLAADAERGEGAAESRIETDPGETPPREEPVPIGHGDRR